jgi:arsenite methyltransferase
MTELIKKPNYGIDAPGLVRFFFIAGIVTGLACLITNYAMSNHQLWAYLIKAILGILSAYLIGMGCLMVYWSKVVKIKERDSVLDQIQWKGNERVLDVGCGRGLMLIGAARRLTSGRAIGIDIWSAKDQSSNSPDGALDNARIEGVLEKVEIQTADMRALPFADHSFDVIVSHWVIHNLASEADRNLSLSEMARVLRPGGSLILCDIENRNAYVERLKALGLTDCRMVFQPFKDAVLGAVSFGSFRPTAIYARQPLQNH